MNEKSSIPRICPPYTNEITSYIFNYSSSSINHEMQKTGPIIVEKCNIPRFNSPLITRGMRKGRFLGETRGSEKPASEKDRGSLKSGPGRKTCGR